MTTGSSSLPAVSVRDLHKRFSGLAVLKGISLDAYEGVPLAFRRQEIQIAGQSEPVWAYFYQGDVSGMKDCGEGWPSPEHLW